jgi:hypothetical protein
MIEITFLIPTERNSDRAKHSPLLIEWFQGRLLDLFGGYTLAGEVEGAWVDQHGNVIRDKSQQYRVAVEDGRESKVWDLLKRAKGRFDQELIYAAVTSNHVRLV